ncbi:uncharacterized protein [Fopius arisanus]|uniref:Uncharacterized protein n=1 Tax=Fopius arisanus TaxID=64838 RepID=A0A9R1T4B1_9HYME|nr:PREDICTED: uncharacterized protein LOC105266179 [Fopius arisanus]
MEVMETAGDLKSPDEDVLEILEDLETYAEDINDDFREKSVAENSVNPKKPSKTGVEGFLDILTSGAPRRRRKSRRGGRKRLCKKCGIRKTEGCTCPKPLPIPQGPVSRKISRRRNKSRVYSPAPAVAPMIVPVFFINDVFRRPQDHLAWWRMSNKC